MRCTRPGVDIVSKTADGDLVVQGDLDLSGMRYASLNPRFQVTNARGSGEVGASPLRAGGDLSIYGSINDGFAPPPSTQDDIGWKLLPGRDINGSDVIVPGKGVTLADGTVFLVASRSITTCPSRPSVSAPTRACPWTWS